MSMMEIKASAYALLEKWQHDVAHPNLLSKVRQAYAVYVSKALLDILENEHHPETLADRFEVFLKDNWQLVQGSCLTYTARPNDEVTALLCDVAASVVEVKRSIYGNESIGMIQVLMPGVSKTTLDDHYLSLDPVFNATEQQWMDVDITSILKTYITAQDGFSLIPVSMLAYLKADAGFNPLNALINPYFDVDKPNMSPQINETEQARLQDHSVYTQTVMKTKKNYELLLNDQQNLLGELRHLCHQLIFNSNKGVGTEYEAGAGAFSALEDFRTYYDSLEAREKRDIPNAVQEEIKTLLDLVFDPIRNAKAAQTNELCIFDRRDDLMRVVYQHEKELYVIGTQSENKEARLAQAEELFEQSKQVLEAALLHPDYAGYDKLGLPVRVLKKLGVACAIFSPDDLMLLKQLTPDELREFLAEPYVAQQFTRQFSSLGDLIEFIKQLSPEQLRSVLIATHEELYPSWLSSVETLFSLLATSNEAQCQVICEVLRDNYPFNGEALEEFEEWLPKFSRELFKIIAPLVLFLVQNYRQFKRVLSSLASSEGLDLIFCDSAHDTLLKLVKDLAGVNAILSTPNVTQRAILFEAIKDKLPLLIRSATDFWSISNKLNASQKAWMYEKFHQQLTGWIDSRENLISILVSLAPAQCETFCQVHRSLLNTHLSTLSDVIDFLQRLEPLQCAIICQVLVKEGPFAHELGPILNSLDEKQCMAVCQTCLSSVSRALDVYELLNTLKIGPFTLVCNMIKSDLRQLSGSTSSLLEVLTSFTDVAQRQLIYTTILEKDPSLYLNDSHLEWLRGAQISMPGSTHFFCDTWSSQTSEMKQKYLERPKMEFELALAYGTLEELNVSFHRLVNRANTHRSLFFACGLTRSCTQLMDSLSALENKQLLEKLSDALNMHWSQEQLESPQFIKQSLLDYINSDKHEPPYVHEERKSDWQP